MKHQRLLISGGLFSKIITTAVLFTLLTGAETIYTGTALAGTDDNYLPNSYPVTEKYLSNTDVMTGDPKCTGVPTVATKPATDITATCATLKGTVNPNTGSTNYWFEWGTSTAYGNTTTPKYAGGGSTTMNVFSYISGLVAGTSYHFRLVATNPLGTSYANDMSFVAGSVTLTTSPVTGITINSAISGGIITSNGGFPVTSRGICWSNEPDPTIADMHTSNGSGNGSFISMIDSLVTMTIYYVRSYATNATGTYYGNEIEFFTDYYFGPDLMLPFSETFSNGEIPSIWGQFDHLGNGQGWQYGVINNQSPVPLLNGNYAFLNSNNYGTGDTQNADLFSPNILCPGSDTIYIQFKYFFLNSSSSSGTFYYTLDSGSDWMVLQTCTSTSTLNPETFSQQIILPGNQSSIRFRWNYTGNYGSYWAIDDFQVNEPPTISVDPSNIDVSASSGTAYFNLHTSTICSVTSDQTWCSATIDPSWTGNPNLLIISAAYLANNTNAQRQANITVMAPGADTVVVTITQAAAPLSLTVTPANRNVISADGSTTFTVTTSLDWSASSDQLWCTVTPTGVGNGTITATYEMNTTNLPRVASITVTAGGVPAVVVTVTQATSSLTVNPSNRNVSENSGTTTFIVTSTVNWTASSNQPWCTVTPSGSGNGVITANFGENNANEIRVAQITISAPGEDPVVVTVTQLTYNGSDNFLLSVRNLTQTSPNSLEFDVYLMCTETIQPFELAGLQFGFLLNSAIYSGGVLSATFDNTGSGLNISQYLATPPSIVSALNGYPGLTLIRQAGKAPPGAGNGTIISTTGDGTLITHYTITSSVPFTANTYPNLTFTSNTVHNPLYATRVAAYINSVNTQLPVIPGVNAIIPENPLLNGPPILEVIPGSQTVDSTAGNVGFVINANTTWVANTDQSWVTITPSGFGNGTLMAIYDPNNSEPRSAVITISAPGIEDVQVTLNQEGVELRTLNLNLLIEGLYAGNGTMNQAHDANGPHFEAGISDLISVELHNSSDYDMIEHIATGVEVSTTGNATINLPHTLNGSYYITIKHRNSIETTSASPVLFDTQNISYDYNSPAKAFGNNLQLMIDGHCVIKSGDINQDGIIDTADLTLIDNSAYEYASGYITPDINGDGLADTADMTIVDNNSADYVSAITP